MRTCRWQGDGRAVVRITDGSDSPDEADTSVSATLAFRLPAWAGGEAAADTIRVEGAVAGRLSRARYVTATCISPANGGMAITVTFDFPMPVRMLAANPNVREDAGKVAFMRGPVTYCAEGIDNGAALHLLHVDAAAVAADPDAVRIERTGFHAGAEGLDERGTGEVDIRRA